MKNKMSKTTGNSVMRASNYVVAGNLFRQAGGAKEPYTPKYFASEKLFEYLLSHETHNKASVALYEVKAFSNPRDTSALCVTTYFLRFSPHAQMH